MEFISLRDSFDMTVPMGRAMFGMLAVFAEFEKESIRERVKAGLRNAKAKGRVPGFKRQTLDLVGIRARMAAGESMRACARSAAVSPALLSTRLREMSA